MRWLSFISRRVSTTMFRYLCLRGISCINFARYQQPPSSWAAVLCTGYPETCLMHAMGSFIAGCCGRQAMSTPDKIPA